MKWPDLESNQYLFDVDMDFQDGIVATLSDWVEDVYMAQWIEPVKTEKKRGQVSPSSLNIVVYVLRGTKSKDSSLISPMISSKISSIVTNPAVFPSVVMTTAIWVRLCCILVNTF